MPWLSYSKHHLSRWAELTLCLTWLFRQGYPSQLPCWSLTVLAWEVAQVQTTFLLKCPAIALSFLHTTCHLLSNMFSFLVLISVSNLIFKFLFFVVYVAQRIWELISINSCLLYAWREFYLSIKNWIFRTSFYSFVYAKIFQKVLWKCS